MSRDGMSNTAVEPIKIRLTPNVESPLGRMDGEQHCKVLDFLVNRLKEANSGTKAGVSRSARLHRMARIDQLISTWQKLSPEDAERERIEDVTGRNQAIPINLPLLATHLDDMTSYFSEVFSPIGGGFWTSEGSEAAVRVLKEMNKDAAARDHYAEMCLTIRSLLKYNLGGFVVEWEPEGSVGAPVEAAGNRWKGLDLYNTLWDPSIKNPKNVSTQAEWAAYVEIKNRVWLIRQSMAGVYARVEHLLASASNPFGGQSPKKVSFYRHPPANAGMTSDGSDSKEPTGSRGGGMTAAQWDFYGFGVGGEGSAISDDQYEVVRMFCWCNPWELGLLSDEEQKQLKGLDVNKDSFLELWKFTIVDGSQVVEAMPVIPREQAFQIAQAKGKAVIAGTTIPMHLAYMTQDQIEEAQRSYMELMRGFQRFSSYLINIYIAGMRKNIWGMKGYDPTMFDVNESAKGEVAGWLRSKVPGRDVRTGLMGMESNAGVDQAMDALGRTMDLSNRFFPSQQLPSQVASIDRAVKSQVAEVVQGATRRLRMIVRLLDSSLMNPTRKSTYMNLVYFTPEKVGKDLTDEDMAKVVGSGIESMEAERIVDALKEILFVVIQNREAMQTFDVPGLMAYMSQLMHLGVNLGQFAKEQAAPQAQARGQGQADAQGRPTGSGVPAGQAGAPQA